MNGWSESRFAQKCPRVCYAGATQAVQLELEWVKGQGLAGLALVGLQCAWTMLLSAL